MSSVVALVPAAGRGERLGHAIPKAFVHVGGVEMLRRATEGLLASGVVDRVIVMAPAALVAHAAQLLGPEIQVIEGGIERTDSVRLGLAAAGECTHVLVHDAARALTPPSLIADVVRKLLRGSPAVVPVLPVVDTIKTLGDDGHISHTPDRARLRAVQTPQGFEVGVLRRAYEVFSHSATDDAGLVEQLGVPVHVVDGHPSAFKITTPLDLVLAEALLEQTAVGGR
jgi:2-C-methyl-D-erythritol 4-phosphate cytidylyltransferase